MYQRIVGATDPTRPTTAVTIASALGADVGALELVTVTPPGAQLGRDRFDLQRIAIQHGWLPASCTVLPGRDIAATLLHHVARRRGALLVVGSHTHHPSTPTDGTITRQLLAATTGPVLVVGPNVDNRFRAHPGRLLVTVDGPDPVTATLDAVESWVRTFGSARAWVVDVVGPDGTDAAGGAAERWVRALDGRDLPVAQAVQPATGGDPGELTGTGTRNAVVVATSRRGDDGQRLVPGVTLDLIRRGRHPVLVVPDHRHAALRDELPAASGPLALPT